MVGSGKAILIAWFFVSISSVASYGASVSHGVATVIGPFQTQKDCELVKTAVDEIGRSRTTHCWRGDTR